MASDGTFLERIPRIYRRLKIDCGMNPWGDERPYNSYSNYFRKLFGARVQKVTINAGFNCPNRDGTLSEGGCTFCNNSAFTPSYCIPQKSVTQQIDEGIEFHRNRYREASDYLAYFQSFSNTHAPLSRLQEVYDEALSHPAVKGIVIGTRPDCIDDRKLDYFRSLIGAGHYVTIEYGIESCYDQTLSSINRGHDFECARQAVISTAEKGIPVGAHFILGLPGETEQMLIDQTDTINTLPITGIKFHQLQIFKDTAMAQQWKKSPESFKHWGLDEYIDLFIEILRRLRPEIVVERFAGEAPPRYHEGPTWGLIRNEQLLIKLENRLKQLGARQGDRYSL